MKPILFDEGTTTFTNYGLGVLGDVVSCRVTEERNGAYELEMEYPIDGIHYEDIKFSRIIYAIPSDGASAQPFSIYKISKPLNGIITVNAEHISYQTSRIPCNAFTASNVSAALQGLKNNALEDCPFTFWTDKSTEATYKQDVPASIRSRLGGTEGSILDIYGGEYEWDNFTVKLHESRGSDRGVTLRYGKNITDINQETNIANTITGVCPYAVDTSGNLIMLPEHVVYSPNAQNFPEPRDVVVDFSADFPNTTPTVEQLRANANAYINSSGVGVPAVNIKVSFVALWQTEEYKNIASLERVKLCDTVTVYFEKLNIEATAKVIKTEYDVLTERYNSIELGESRTNLSTQMVDLNSEIQDKPSASFMQQAINAATNLITGGLGGYVVMKKNANGKPEEILIMDTDDVTTAVNVIRMNKNGIGFSTTGYNGPFRTAWTIDGHFTADVIDSGTLRAIDINGVNITGSNITGTNITGSDIRSEISGWGAQMSAAGFRTYSTGGVTDKRWEIHQGNINGYNAGGYLTFTAGMMASGFLTLKNQYGQEQTYLSGDYLRVNAAGSNQKTQVSSGGVYGYDSSNNQTFSISNGGWITGTTLVISGNKSRVAETKNYGDRLLYCYETPTPYFGDLGEGKTDESGKCYIFLDDILDESTEGKYQVFLQAYGDGRLYVSERTAAYFVVEGEPNTAFGWELKAPQKGYSLHRLEPFEHEEPNEDNILEETYQYLNQYLYNVEGEVA